MPQRNLLILLSAVAVSYACYVRGEQNPHARYVAEGLATIHGNSLERVPEGALFDGAMRGMIDVLQERGDQHSEFLDEDEADPLRSEIRQQFGGIGVRIGLEGEPARLTIIGPPEPGSPAARADLRAGDQILSIDGRATEGMKMPEVLKRVRGVPGTSVRLSIGRAGQSKPGELIVELVREVIDIESVLGDRRVEDGSWSFRLETDPRIAHVRIVSFGERTADELERVLTNVIANGARGVVLDLRGDAGGSLDAAIAVCRMLLPAGRKIVETRGRDAAVLERYDTTEDGAFLDVPLVVLINQDSASASEIVAACLQDHGRAAIGGQRSYGKGTVQQLVPMQNGKSLLKLTWASFWRPSNVKIHRGDGEAESEKWGVSPDEGLERRLSEDELVRFYEYRGARDQIETTADENSDQAAGNRAGEGYVDEQLCLAVEYLQRRLDGDSP